MHVVDHDRDVVDAWTVALELAGPAGVVLRPLGRTIWKTTSPIATWTIFRSG
jgi:hypothetical protein